MSTPPAPPADPFAPAGIEFRPVSPELRKLRHITAATWFGPLLLGLIAGLVATLVNGAIVGAIVLGVLAVITLGFWAWVAWLIPRQVRALGYAETPEELVLRRGILFKRLTVVPYGRMQFVDVHQGPIARKFGIAALKLHTAAATTDASLPGLPFEEAARLRDRLSARGEAKMAGL